MAKIRTMGLMVFLLCACPADSAYADVAPPDEGCDCALGGRATTAAGPWLLCGALATSAILFRRKSGRR
jgi:hypothetical protein